MGLQRQLTTLTDALDTRNIIGQAQGLLMSQYRVDADAAFAMLTRLSQETNTKLREVAAQLVRATLREGDHVS